MRKKCSVVKVRSPAVYPPVRPSDHSPAIHPTPHRTIISSVRLAMRPSVRLINTTTLTINEADNSFVINTNTGELCWMTKATPPNQNISRLAHLYYCLARALQRLSCSWQKMTLQEARALRCQFKKQNNAHVRGVNRVMNAITYRLSNIAYIGGWWGTYARVGRCASRYGYTSETHPCLKHPL